jgi:hypothetical protein
MFTLTATHVDEYVASLSGGSDSASSVTDYTQPATTALIQLPSPAQLEMTMLPWVNGGEGGGGSGGGGGVRALAATTLTIPYLIDFEAAAGIEPAASARAKTGCRSALTFPVENWGGSGAEIHAHAETAVGPSLSQPDDLAVASETRATPTISPLMHAVIAGDVGAVLGRLIQPTARVNAKDANGQTALHLCVLGFKPAEHEHVWMPMLVALITAGANPDAADSDMATSLMYACRLGFPPLIERLLAGGICSLCMARLQESALWFLPLLVDRGLVR